MWAILNPLGVCEHDYGSDCYALAMCDCSWMSFGVKLTQLKYIMKFA